MSGATARVWLTDADYLGCTGANSVREMAEAVHRDPEILDCLNLCGEPSIEDVEAALSRQGVSPITIPVPVFRRERWDGAWMAPCAPDAKPGRGYVKVLGVHL